MAYFKRTLLGMIIVVIVMGMAWGLQAQNACPGASPSRLLIGSLGRVIPVGDPNNVRKEPSKTGKKLGQIDPGKTFTVYEGPVCADDITWVRVKDDNGIFGWTAELIGSDYALEPAFPALQPTAVVAVGAVDYSGVHVDVDPSLAAQIEGKIDLGQPSGVEVFPGGVVLILQDNSGQTVGVLHVVSAQGFNNRYLTSILSLSDVLAGTPTPEAQISPKMSWFVNNGTLIASGQPQTFTFKGGQGVRRLALYGQTPDTPDDHLTYEAHALTTDGLYYIQAAFNVASSDLASLTPSVDLAQFDAVLASLTIAPDTLSDAITESDTIATAYAPTQVVILTQQSMPTQAPTSTLSAEELAMTATASVRCGAFDSTLHIGDLARQSLKDGTIRVRQSPGGDPIPNTRLFFEDEVRVEEGPVCVDETNWWRVAPADGSWDGWVAEAGLDSVYMVWLSPTPLPPTDIPAGPTPVPTQAYDCTYTPATAEHALIEPLAEGKWEYFLIAGHTYHAIYQLSKNGQTWYALALESPINVREDGTGATHMRITWVLGATGSECGSLPVTR